MAYRGGGQIINFDGFGNQDCSAINIVASANTGIENTVGSVKEAVSKGFEIIHLNIHYTSDYQFAVFHDWNLDCATDGSGATASKTLEELKILDAGFGYTTDQGSSFPWRGQGIQIPSFNEIVDQYPQQEFWLNLKSHDKQAELAAIDFIKRAQQGNKRKFVLILSGKNKLQEAHQGSRIRITSYPGSKECMLHYMLLGWSRFFPASCANTLMMVPPEYAPYVWGWPEQFAARAHQNGSRVFLWSKHTVFEHELDLRHVGVGIVTGDLSYL